LKISILGSGPIPNKLAQALGNDSTVNLYTSQDISISGVDVLSYESFLSQPINSDLVILAWRGLPELYSEKGSVLKHLVQNISNQALIMNMSSVAVYGHNQGINIETLRPRPINPYGVAKLELESYLNNWLGSRVCHLRISNVFGHPKFTDVVNSLLNSKHSGAPLMLVEPSKILRDYISIDTLIHIILELVKTSKEIAFREIFNVGSGFSLSLLELKFVFDSCIGSALPFIAVESRLEIIEVSQISNEKIVNFVNISTDDEIEQLRRYFMKSLGCLDSDVP
jgi:hypothetical protein